MGRYIYERSEDKSSLSARFVRWSGHKRGKKEGKLLQGIIEVLDEFADSVGSLEEAQEQMEEYLDSIDEDSSPEDEICESDDMACGEEYIEVDCPGCGETVCFDAGIVDDDDVGGCPSQL